MERDPAAALTPKRRLGVYEDQEMWEQVRLPSGAYAWAFLVASDCDEPWALRIEDAFLEADRG